jgi:NAD(P)-dependent dehydrogenase (short-subunit alcohol dehydrogenase family)
MSTRPPGWDMEGRRILVTGGSGGIGFATAQALVGRGADVIITGRDAGRGETAAAAIRRENDRGSATFLQADHATVGGNQQLADQVRAAWDGLDVLINNVGGLYDTRWETADGYEATLAMNVVGPFALTAELLPLLRSKPPSRCVNVVSAAFRMYKGDPFDDPQSTDRFVGADAYARTKLLNVLFSLALAKRVSADHITVNQLHPGLTWTPMTRSMTPATMPAWRLAWPIIRLLQRHGSPEKAAQRVLFLAASPEASTYTGEYFERQPRPKRLSARELDPALQDRAWQLASGLVVDAPTNKRTQAATGQQSSGLNSWPTGAGQG